MHIRIVNIFIFLFLFIGISKAQDNYVDKQQFEIEAAKQTDFLRRQLNLTDVQTEKVYEINLRYAQKRQKSIKRSDAVDLIKAKNEEIELVLQNNQKEQLRNVRHSFQTSENQESTRTHLRTNGVQNRSATSNSSDVSNPSKHNRIDMRQATGNRPVRGEIRSQAESTVRHDAPNSVRNPRQGNINHSSTQRTPQNPVAVRNAPTRNTQQQAPVRVNDNRRR